MCRVFLQYLCFLLYIWLNILLFVLFRVNLDLASFNLLTSHCWQKITSNFLCQQFFAPIVILPFPYTFYPFSITLWHLTICLNQWKGILIMVLQYHDIMHRIPISWSSATLFCLHSCHMFLSSASITATEKVMIIVSKHISVLIIHCCASQKYTVQSRLFCPQASLLPLSKLG